MFQSREGFVDKHFIKNTQEKKGAGKNFGVFTP